MNSIDVLKDLASRPLEVLRYSSSGITGENLNAHPGGHDNSIAWLLWHAGRQMDVQLSDLSGLPQVWTELGFDERFGLDVGPHEHGFGHTGQQARAVVVKDKQLLLDYLEAAVEALISYLGTLNEAALGEIVDEDWTPAVTRGARLVSISVDAVQHVAQAAYAAGAGS